jgi:hypothetical protein
MEIDLIKPDVLRLLDLLSSVRGEKGEHVSYRILGEKFTFSYESGWGIYQSMSFQLPSNALQTQETVFQCLENWIGHSQQDLLQKLRQTAEAESARQEAARQAQIEKDFSVIRNGLPYPVIIQKPLRLKKNARTP